jgi:desulfoferrodoxin (superoxide reductase-like protein)
MKKCLLIFFAVLFLGTTAAFAHPPKSVTVTYDKDTKMLLVSFVHNVDNPMNHYIKQIVVTINKKNVITQNNFHQESKDGGSFSYKIIDAKAGDTITASAQCSVYGKKATDFVVK